MHGARSAQRCRDPKLFDTKLFDTKLFDPKLFYVSPRTGKATARKCALWQNRALSMILRLSACLFAAHDTTLGTPEFAQLTRNLYAPAVISLDYDWGLDHGVWTILQALLPTADLAVL